MELDGIAYGYGLMMDESLDVPSLNDLQLKEQLTATSPHGRAAAERLGGRATCVELAEK